MITLEQEKKVREGLKAGKAMKGIARHAGVSIDAVYTVQNMLEVVASISPKKRLEIRACLEAGLPVGAIEARHKVLRKWVYAMRRYHYIQPDRFPNRPPICPVCKSVRSPEKIFAVPRLEDECLQEHLGYDDAVEMFRLCEDLDAMGSLDLSINPLFYRLVKIAKVIVEKIHGKNSSDR